ncbi:hypothetical protein RHGRI_008749 [Rhododendron griersonianum]|uniref:Uncharacterized protein n=1 Tax=Rhododendron griersonianum TaxID=479676 RepID=A0AAV6L1G8_9ERIC|nr:hypothetical protein RHGRI_008749 [Rhododendron griersonianum]
MIICCHIESASGGEMGGYAIRKRNLIFHHMERGERDHLLPPPLLFLPPEEKHPSNSRRTEGWSNVGYIGFHLAVEEQIVGGDRGSVAISYTRGNHLLRRSRHSSSSSSDDDDSCVL